MQARFQGTWERDRGRADVSLRGILQHWAIGQICHLLVAGRLLIRGTCHSGRRPCRPGHMRLGDPMLAVRRIHWHFDLLARQHIHRLLTHHDVSRRGREYWH